MAEIEKEQEEKLKAKVRLVHQPSRRHDPAGRQRPRTRERRGVCCSQYGGLKPKTKLMPKDHKFFDSADWAMQQQDKPTKPAVRTFDQQPPLSAVLVRPS